MADNSLLGALTVVLTINLFLWFGQLAVISINPDGEGAFITPGDNLLNDFNSGNYTLNEDLNSQLPESTQSVSETTGNIFTDTWSTIKNWVLDSTGVSFISKILGAPFSFLKALSLPPEFAFGLGALWYGLTLLLLIMFIRGG